MKIISVVRDFDLYKKIVFNNHYYGKDVEFISFDNRTENLGISQRYNTFLNNYDYSKKDWLVFCHEDWELKEEIYPKLDILDKNCLYGPIGKIAHTKIFNLQTNIGQIENSNRDGSNLQIIGLENYNLQRASTFDCQCLIVHSSLIEKYKLRFDENLFFDLYVEDFCINARENYNIPSKILQICCHHWSWGKLSDRFWEKYSYLQKKYNKTKEYYTTTCSNEIIGNNFLLPLYKLVLNKNIFLKKQNFIQNIFSIKNSKDKKHKQICILGFKFKIRRKVI